MTVTLGGIALSDHLILDIGSTGVGFSERRLIGGASVVQLDGSSGGRTLRLGNERHWTMAQVDQVRALESAALPITLVHHRGTFTVVIIDTSELELSQRRSDPASTAWFSGTITLKEV